MKFTITNQLRSTILALGSLAVLNLILADNSIRSLNQDSGQIYIASSVRGESQRTFKWHLFGD
jgi:hypothetical protein